MREDYRVARISRMARSPSVNDYWFNLSYVSLRIEIAEEKLFDFKSNYLFY